MVYKYGKPLIGLAGGIGSGKSFVAKALQDEGCGVVDSDMLAHEVLGRPETGRQLAAWWGAGMLDAQGQADRREIGRRVFNDPAALAQLNGLVHPAVHALRMGQTTALAQNSAIRAIVWDTPLLFETGLNQECDAVIYVKCPYDQRLSRVSARRGWTSEQLEKREKLQISLDKKEELADYVVENHGDEPTTRRQVHQILARILSTQAAQ